MRQGYFYSLNLLVGLFFRFRSENNSNKQSKGSIPFLRLYFERERTTLVTRHRRRSMQATFMLELRFEASSSDINDAARFVQADTLLAAVYNAILPNDEDTENYLNLEYIKAFEIETEFIELGGTEAIKQTALEFKILFEYERV